MKAMLTGAAGFLGSHITQKLLENNIQVHGLDDLSTGTADNINSFLSNPLFTFEKHDIRLPYKYEADVILNFACPASPKFYQKDPVRTTETNFLGMANVLRLAKDTGAKVVQASTSEVYGDPTMSPQKESYWGNVNPIGIRACYDEGKRAAETLCFDYKREHGIDVRVIRIFNTYGPNMAVDDGRVVSNFIVQALRHEPITIYGNGHQTRSFCYVSDLINAIYNLMNLSTPQSSPINIGNPAEHKMVELAEKIVRITKSKSKITFLPLPLDDPKQRKPDITLARQILEWSPQIDLESGLGLTVDYFRKKMNV